MSEMKYNVWITQAPQDQFNFLTTLDHSSLPDIASLGKAWRNSINSALDVAKLDLQSFKKIIELLQHYEFIREQGIVTSIDSSFNIAILFDAGGNSKFTSDPSIDFLNILKNYTYTKWDKKELNKRMQTMCEKFLLIWHMLDNGSLVSKATFASASAAGDFRYSITPEGNIQIYKGTQLQPSLGITCTSDEVSNCPTNKTCWRIGYIMGSRFRDGSSIAEHVLDELVKDTEPTRQLSSAFSILRRIGWKVELKNNKPVVCSLEDLTLDAVKDLKDIIVTMFTNDNTDKPITEKVLLETWDTIKKQIIENKIKAVSAASPTELAYTYVAELIKKCIEIVNLSPDIITSQVDATKLKRFSQTPAVGKNRIYGFAKDSTLTAYPSSMVSGLFIGGSEQSGGAVTASTMLRSTMDRLEARLVSVNKMLAPDTRKAIYKKIDELDDAEKVVKDFIELFRKFNTNSLDKYLATTVNEDQMKQFVAAGDTIVKKTMTIQSVFGTIEAKITERTPPSSVPGSLYPI